MSNEVFITNFLDQYKRKVSDVGGTRGDTIVPLINWILDALGKLEVVAIDVQMQREKLRTIAQNLRYEAENLFADEIDPTQLATVPQPSTRTPEDDEYRRRVLEVANRMDDVAPADIRDAVEAQMGRLPWKNPNAAIATILSRSSMWTRKKDGRWTRKPTLQLNI